MSARKWDVFLYLPGTRLFYIFRKLFFVNKTEDLCFEVTPFTSRQWKEKLQEKASILRILLPTLELFTEVCEIRYAMRAYVLDAELRLLFSNLHWQRHHHFYSMIEHECHYEFLNNNKRWLYIRNNRPTNYWFFQGSRWCSRPGSQVSRSYRAF